MSALIEVLKLLLEIQGKPLKGGQSGSKHRRPPTQLQIYKDGINTGLLLALVALIVFLILFLVLRGL